MCQWRRVRRGKYFNEELSRCLNNFTAISELMLTCACGETIHGFFTFLVSRHTDCHFARLSFH